MKTRKGQVWKSMREGPGVAGGRLLRRAPQGRRPAGPGPPHAAEAAIVGGETGVGVPGALPLAVGGAARLGAGVPVAAAHHALDVAAGIGRPGGIRRGTVLVIG